LGEPKVHDIHELAIIHVIFVGLPHSNIHVVDFEEDNFKGTLSYDEILHNYVVKQELEHEQEEIKRVTLNQFQRLLQQEQDTHIAREQEKARKDYQKKGTREQKSLQAE
jgi:hypothetical protein